MKKILVLFVFFELVLMSSYAADDFKFYQENNKHGVLYNDEVVLLPRFDNVAYLQEGCIFFYKEGKKWGIANLWKKITDPFADTIYYANKNYHIYKLNNKYGICNNDGEINDLQCDSIKEFDRYDIFKCYKNDKSGVCNTNGDILIPIIYDDVVEIFRCSYKTDKAFREKMNLGWKEYKMYYFVVKDNGFYKILDVFNNEIFRDTIQNVSLNAKKKDFSRWIIAKKEADYIRKTESERIVKRCELMGNAYPYRLIFCDTDKYGYQNRLVLSYYPDYGIKSYIRDFLFSTDSYKKEEAKKVLFGKREIYFGQDKSSFNKKPLSPAQGDSIILSGFKGISNTYGFISIPLEYPSPYQRLTRNPSNIFYQLDILLAWGAHLDMFGDKKNGYQKLI